MALKKAGQGALQLSGAVPVDEPQRALIVQQRLVQKPLRPRERFVDGQADHVQIRYRGAARPELDVHAHRCGRSGAARRGGEHPQVPDACTHVLAAHIDLGRAVVDGRDHALQAEAADGHTVAHAGPSTGRRKGRRGFVRRLHEPLHDLVDRGSGVAAGVAGIAGRNHPAPPVGDGRGLRPEARNHLVDLPPRLPRLGVELLGELAAEGILPMLEGLFPLAHARFARLERFALAGGESMFVLERTHVAVDLRQVLGELRLARADVPPRGGNHGRVQPEPRGDLERQTPPWRSVDQRIRGRERLSFEPERRARDALGR